MNRLAIAAAMVVSLAVRPALQTVTEPQRQEALRHYRLGEQALHFEHYDDAEKQFQGAAQLDPFLDLAQYGLGQVYMATKRYRLAVNAYNKCRDVFRAATAELLQDETKMQQRIDDRIRALEDAKQGYESGIARTASTVATIQRLDMQIRDLKSQRRRNADRPPDVPAWISIALGSAYFRAGAIADAEREYRAALAVDPRLGEGHNNLAVVCMLTGRFAEADAEIKAAEKAGFKVNPQLKDDLRKASARR
jgi:tetratricopeptide (TPR) repeat protein